MTLAMTMPVTMAMTLSAPLTALATDNIDHKLALICTKNLFLKGKGQRALEDHQQFVCYFKGDSYGDTYNFHSVWTSELLRP